MSSACVNNNVSVSPYGCFNPRAASFSREDARSSGSAASEMKKLVPAEEVFEFRSGDTVGMLPADELFSDGKLMTTAPPPVVEAETEVTLEDSCLVSPKAPRCSSRWRELLGLKRFSQNSKTAAATSFHSNPRSSTSSLKQFLHRSSKTSSFSDGSLISLPLLSDSESLSVSSSRMSLSSSSCSSHDYLEDNPRLSLDAERLNHLVNQNITANPFAPARPRMRLVKPRDNNNHTESGTGGETCQSVSVDSPRLNSSGKIVFQSLERSSSSPSGTSGYRNRGVERSYSVNVRVAPVLNVPVCSVRGGSVIFSQFFSSASSQHNRTGSSGNNRASSHHQHGGISRGRNSTDRVAS